MRHLLRRPVRRRSGFRRAVLGLVAFAASLLFLVAAGGTVLFVRLRQGPIAVDVKQQIVSALDRRVGHGYRFDLAGAAIAATDNGPALKIDALSVMDAASRPIVSAPSAAIAVDPLALLAGRIAPTRLEIDGVDLRLVIRPDGQVAVSAGSDAAAVPLATAFAAPPQPPDARPPDAQPLGGVPHDVAPRDAVGSTPPRPGNAALRALAAAMRSLVDVTTATDSALNALQRVSVTGRLVLDDRMQGRTTIFRDAVLGFDRDADGTTTLTVAADGPAGRWSLTARAGAAADGTKTLGVDVADLSLDELTLAGGLHDTGFDFDMPVSAHLAVALGADGDIGSAVGTFSLGSGYFKLDDPDHEPLLVDAVKGGFHVDAGTDGISIDRTELRAGGSDFVLSGHVDVPRGPDEPWAVRAEASGLFGVERPNEKPIRIAHAGFGLRLFPAARRLVVDKAEVTGPDVDFNATAEIRADGRGLRVRNTSSVRHMPVQTLVRLWPSFIAASVRAWLIANLRGGTVESGTAVSDLDGADLALMKADRAVADDHLRVSFAVSNASLAVMAGVPSLSDLDGSGTVTGRTFVFDAKRGGMDVAPGHRLTLLDGTMRVLDTDPKPTPAVIEAHVAGGVESVTDLLAREALKPYAALPADGVAMHGSIDGHLTVGLKLGRDASPDSATVALSATATNLSVEKLIGKEGLSDATIKLDSDRSGLRAKGEGRIYGVPATLELHKPAGGPGDALVAMVLDEAARAKAGLNLGSVLKGPVAARIAATLVSGEKTKASVDLDFGRAAIDGVVPGYTKPAGHPARATLTVQARDGGTAIDNIAFEGGGATVRGSADLGRDGDFVSAKLSQVKMSPGDDLRVDLQQSGDVLKVTARGANLDARPFLKWLTAPAAPGGAEAAPSRGALELDLRSTILTGQNGQAITGADLRLTRRAGQIRKLVVSGRIARQPLTVATAQIDNAPHFLIHAGDAGASLLFLDLYKRMGGGRLDANVVMVGQRLDGYATVHDFNVKEDPAIRKLAVEGLASQKREEAADAAAGAAALNSSDMSFRKLEVYFTKTGSTVEVRDGSMFGPGLGATVAGTIDFGRDQVKLAGTFVPLFGVNNLFSQLPLFGPLLGGGRHEGLVGLSYRITGSAGNPTLNVNPLSVLAPGFLREIVGALDGSGQGGAPSSPHDNSVGPAADQAQ